MLLRRVAAAFFVVAVSIPLHAQDPPELRALWVDER
jgi:hypothetical protein